MVRSGADPFWVRESLGLPSNFEYEPDWCFNRFGMTRTAMPDGRIICIAGEHEDHYDPDFCIYNDVIALTPETGSDEVTENSGNVEIYSYPESVFPPTDFHSATLIDDFIYIIGCLGYQGARHPRTTPVLRLDTRTYEIHKLDIAGDCPGWIWDHYASYDEARGTITVRGGKREVEGVSELLPNFAAHRLVLEDLRWEQVASHEQHRKFLLEVFPDRQGPASEPGAAAFQPARVPCAVLPTKDCGVPEYAIDVGGVRVRFREFYSEVRVHVDGKLSESTLKLLFQDVINNLRTQTGVQWRSREVPLDTDWES